jgi:hypothetical protein
MTFYHQLACIGIGVGPLEGKGQKLFLTGDQLMMLGFRPQKNGNK